MSAQTKTKATLTLPSDREILMTRVFDAPRELVFKAYTDPELVKQWWGLRNNTLTIDKMDVRPGGVWRYVERDAEGNEFGFRGEYREIVPLSRIVNTFEFEGMPGHIGVITTTFTELPGGKTEMKELSLFDSKEDRDGLIQSGMEGGANESYERLDELLARAVATR